MDVRQRVGLNVQRVRRSRGYSQEDLAERAQVHQTYLSGVESGKRNPTVVVLDRLAVALGVELTELTKRPSDEAPSAAKNDAKPASANM